MTDLLLTELDVTNFRSIRGHLHVPLDARVVLIYGENGAGKTSLLSAVELALTGSIPSLRRADPNYARQLLHRSTAHGNVTVKTSSSSRDTKYEARLDERGAHSVAALDNPFASFFTERAYLPQSLLGQLLQIYQESGSRAESPLARFVGELLGLGRLDALEMGLKPLTDVRNVRKVVDDWSQVEFEKTRLGKLLEDQRTARTGVAKVLSEAIQELSKNCAELNLPVDVHEETLEYVTEEISENDDEKALDQLTDRLRHLASIQRELIDQESVVSQDNSLLHAAAEKASSAYTSWENVHGARIAELRTQIETLLPHASLPSDHAPFGDESLTLLRTEQDRLSTQEEQARLDHERLARANNEMDVAKEQLAKIDEELVRIPESAGTLGAVLSELTSFVDGDVCPVCDRNFVELECGSLVDHLHTKVRQLSASGTRLIALGRSRTEQHVAVQNLEREIAALAARVLDAKSLANLARQTATVSKVVVELEAFTKTLYEGTRLRARDIEARRAVSEANSRNISLAAARETLSEFAFTLKTEPVEDSETLLSASLRLEKLLSFEASRFERRLVLRRKSVELLTTIQDNLIRRDDFDAAISGYRKKLQRVESALDRAQLLRRQGINIRKAVDSVRTTIIRREFNDRLNRVWRDLFIRLAPAEPFVPAFRIPQSSTQRLQPKLITEYQSGSEFGGTPGAMLSMGNLNTAALTLFIALHLSVPKRLPWLIFDDSVQSMDDLHVTHLASLLRTLSKEHGRQVVISVHDRQLFEYLRLELSPAFPDDSLLTHELARRHGMDTLCVSRRLRFQEETALEMVA